MPLAYNDGQYCDKNDIAMKLADYGFCRGLSVFDFTRVYGGKPFRLDDHIERLFNGAKQLDIALPLTKSAITTICQKLCSENKYAHSGLRFYLTAGECGNPDNGFTRSDGFAPRMYILEDEFKSVHPDAPHGLDVYQRGMAIKTVPFARELATVKTINYSLGYHASRLLAGREWDDILFVTPDGYVTEAMTANFFCVIDGILCTPSRGMLYGVTRKVVLELVAQIDLPVAERDIKLAELANATEAYVTSSGAEIKPISRIDDHKITLTTDAPVYQKLRAAFSQYRDKVCPP